MKKPGREEWEWEGREGKERMGERVEGRELIIEYCRKLCKL